MNLYSLVSNRVNRIIKNELESKSEECFRMSQASLNTKPLLKAKDTDAYLMVVGKRFENNHVEQQDFG